MDCTSINHCQFSNFQSDYFGTEQECIAAFEKWCDKWDVIWGHLFDIKSGECVCTYYGDGFRGYE